MISKRKYIIFSIIFLITLNIATIVNASSFNFTAQAQKEIFKPGEEVIVDVKINDIDAGKEGINVVEMFFEYDNNFFESLEFENRNNWKSEYNTDTKSDKFGKVLFVKLTSGVNKEEEIVRLKLKLKSKLEDSETKIKFKQITSNDGKELMHVNDKPVTIKIQNDKDEPIKEEKPGFIENITNMPETGQVIYVYLVLGVIIVIIASILVYIKLKNNKKDKEKTK